MPRYLSDTDGGIIFGVHGCIFWGMISKRIIYWLVQKWVGGSFFNDLSRLQNWLCPSKFVKHSVTPISISSTFYAHFFRRYFGAKKISNPKHSFVIFGAKILYEKLKRKTLMKLTKVNNPSIISSIHR